MEYDGDAMISSAEDMADYAAFSQIKGDLRIESSDIAALRLPELSKVSGNVIITFNELLSDLTDFDAITEIGGKLIIENNDSLPAAAIDKLLEQLKKGNGVKGEVKTSSAEPSGEGGGAHGGDAIINDESDLIIYREFTSIAGKLVVDGLHIRSLNLPKLISVEGDVCITGTSLKSMDGLETLENIGGELVVMDNDLLQDLALSKLKLIGGACYIRNNGELENLNGLKELALVGGDLEISFHSYLPQQRADDFCKQVKSKQGIKGSIEMTGNTGIIL